VFDAATIGDTATFERPKALAVGIDSVLVNGKLAYRSGEAGPSRNGRFLARESRPESS
jgi:N-acyl-D-amino-acid deacylase